MPIMTLSSKRGIWFTGKGPLYLDRDIVAHTGWPNFTRIEVQYIESPFTILLRPSSDSGLQLRYTSPGSSHGSSATIRSRRLARLASRFTVFPSAAFYPLYPTNGLADVAFFVEEPTWTPISFDKTGLQKLSPDTTVVYALQDSRDVIRYGEGDAKGRLNDHMLSPVLADCVRSAAYFVVKDKEESKAFEHLLLTEFQQKHNGKLPDKQLIKA